MSTLRDVPRETPSMRRARRWLAEMRAEATRRGCALDAPAEVPDGRAGR